MFNNHNVLEYGFVVTENEDSERDWGFRISIVILETLK